MDNKNVPCCFNCIYCNDTYKCTQSPFSEDGPADIPTELLHSYRCRCYEGRYPLDMKNRYLKE